MTHVSPHTPHRPTPLWVVGACVLGTLFMLALVVPLSGTAQEGAAAPSSEDSLPTTLDPSTTLEMLVKRVAHQVIERYEKPWGRVVERHRSRVYIVPQGMSPKKGQQFLVLRPVPGMNPTRERLIGKLKVHRVTETLVECRESDRTGNEHAEEGDLVREENAATRVILAPCISAVDLAPVIPEVVGETLRLHLQGRPTLRLVDDLDVEEQVEAAYWSGTMASFLDDLDDVEMVLVPILLRSEERLILNVEYFSVRRRAATGIDVASVPLDEMLLSWLRAGRTRDYAPPGYRSLPAQTFDWSVFAMAGVSGGRLVTILRDSLRVFEFAYPGLRQVASRDLPHRDRVRRQPYVQLIPGVVLQTVARHAGREHQPVALDVSPLQESVDVLWMTSDERRPLRLDLTNLESIRIDDESAQVVEGLRLLWLALDGPQSQRQRWWPSPGGKRSVLMPLFADVDGDDEPDLLWSDEQGHLQLHRRRVEHDETLIGYGDVKSIQPPEDADAHAVVWLTDPVWDGDADRLSAMQYIQGRLRPVWRSKRFNNTLVAVASTDLNSDGATDLVVAEQTSRGTRLHLFLALPGENTAVRGGPWSE
jgi:hypothetical protein